MQTHTLMRGVTLLVLVLLIAGCQATPQPFPTPASELDDRPGLLTGKSGQAVIFSR